MLSSRQMVPDTLKEDRNGGRYLTPVTDPGYGYW